MHIAYLYDNLACCLSVSMHGLCHGLTRGLCLHMTNIFRILKTSVKFRSNFLCAPLVAMRKWRCALTHVNSLAHGLCLQTDNTFRVVETSMHIRSNLLRARLGRVRGHPHVSTHLNGLTRGLRLHTDDISCLIETSMDLRPKFLQIYIQEVYNDGHVLRRTSILSSSITALSTCSSAQTQLNLQG